MTEIAKEVNAGRYPARRIVREVVSGFRILEHLYLGRRWGRLLGMSRIYIKFLVLELVVIAAVITIFKLIETRVYAGATAGTVFVALGLFILITGLRNRDFRRSFTFYAGGLHLFVSALPLMITRLINFQRPFDDVHVLGLPGPVFHRVSTSIYMILLIATVLDLILSLRKSRK